MNVIWTRSHFDINLYELYVKGYLEMARDVLTPEELESLPWGARLMTFECGIRFLMDFLQGDTYFKTAYPEHNLVVPVHSSDWCRRWKISLMKCVGL